MRKEFDVDEEFEEPDDIAKRGPSFPVKVRIAGIAWVLVGFLTLFNTVLSLAIPAVLAVVDHTTSRGCCYEPFLLLVGIALICIGRQTLYGTAGDTLGNAIGSLVLGIALLACGFIGLARVGDADEEMMKVYFSLVVIVGAINILSGILLQTAGALAFIGRSDYREWRRWQKNAQPSEEK